MERNSKGWYDQANRKTKIDEMQKQNLTYELNQGGFFLSREEAENKGYLFSGEKIPKAFLNQTETIETEEV